MTKDACAQRAPGPGPAAWILVLFAVLCAGALRAQFYNGSQLTFGKSRVQYSDRIWLLFRFSKFDTYYYQNGQELARYTAEYADKHIKEIERSLQSNLEQKVQFIIFNNLSDLKESNIGLFNDWEYYNTGGVTRIIGGRVMLFFDGNYEHYDQQVRAGIAQVILNGMIFGTGIGSQIKNTALFTVPDWYMNGLISFISRKWDPAVEDQVRDAVLNGKYGRFNGLSGEEATWAGHSLWHYVSLKYGAAVIPNIVYMARLNRNVEKGFQNVLGIEFQTLLNEWLEYTKELYTKQEAGCIPPEGTVLNKRNKPDRLYNSLKISPDGNSVAYATHQLGIYKIWVQDTEKGKKRRIYRGGYRIADRPDFSYPVIAWHPSGTILAFVIERKGNIWLCFYNLDDKTLERQKMVNFQKVLDISYSDDGTLLVMSAVQKGQSDIFVYNIASGSHDQITKDLYNDLNPRFAEHSSKIIFASNRRSDTIRFDEPVKIGDMGYYNDLFLFDYASRKPVMRRLTDTPGVNESNPMPYFENYFCYLADQNGLVNRYLARNDSSISFIDTVAHYRYQTTSYPVTNYSRSILEQDVSERGLKVGQVVYRNRNYRMLLSELMPPAEMARVELQPAPDETPAVEAPPSVLGIQQADTAARPAEPFSAPRKSHFTVVRRPAEEVVKNVPRTGRAIGGDAKGNGATDGNWQSFIHTLPGKGGKPQAATGDSLDKYKNAKQLNYNVEYYIDQMVTQVDFTYLNFAYQPFTGSSAPVFINPGLNALLMVGVTDLMEDHRISGGVRLNINLINNEYLVSYGNYKRRLDHQIVFHRKSVEEAGYYSLVRHRINELYYVATYPFSPVLNLKGTASVRYDRAVYLSTDILNLKEPDRHQVWGSIKGELTYDNTRSLGLNLYHGTRYKLFGEYYQMANSQGNNLVVLGMDIRNYQKLHRTLVWANRFAASTSFGSSKLLYYMGGVDNWLFPTYYPWSPVATDQNYAFQTLATNMRGFPQNIRNGNSFFVYNTELRWPVFRYLFNRPIRSDFVNNFQLVAFGDIGTAWTGTTPWSPDNQLFTMYVENKPLYIKVELQKDPVVEGFGFGARTRVFGYFLRGDLAWGVEDGRVQKPIFYFSLSLDF